MSLILSSLPRRSKIELVRDANGFTVRAFWTNKEGKSYTKMQMPAPHNWDDPSYLSELVESMIYELKAQDQARVD